MRVILIGSDARIADIATMAIHLRWPEVDPVVVTSVDSALEAISLESLDLILLHSDIADKSPAESIREVRALTHVPLLVLAEEGDYSEAVAAVDAGADDYLRLSCDLTEIMIRIWALVRRAGHRESEGSEGPIRSGTLFLDPSTYEVSLSDQRLPLTNTEFRLLHFLIKHRGAVVAHQAIERALWSRREGSTRITKKYVQRLREKLGDSARKPSWIAVVHGVGYRFIGPSA